MKRCSTCNKTFTDQKLSYCVDDGTPLVEVPDDELTEVGTSWNPPAYQPPSYTSPEGASSKGRTWPLLAAVIGILVIALVGFTIAAAVYLPRLQKKAAESAEAKNNTNPNSSNSNTNSATESKAENDENNEASLNVPPPSDKDRVLAQLKDLEQEWTVANINADKKKLAKILADDYAGPTIDGRIQGKTEYLNTAQRDTTIQKWEFSDLRLTLHGDRATLFGKLHLQMTDKEADYDFVDRFVWREGRWQATGSEVTQKQ